MEMEKPDSNPGNRKLELPDRRKNTYDALEKHLDERLDTIEKTIHTWVRRGVIGFALIGLICTASLFIGGYQLRKESQRNAQLCENQNVRHDNAITVLMVGSNNDIANAEQLNLDPDEIRNRRNVTIGLIDAISPKVNCENPGDLKLIQPQVTPPPMPPPPTPTPTPTP